MPHKTFNVTLNIHHSHLALILTLIITKESIQRSLLLLLDLHMYFSFGLEHFLHQSNQQLL